MKVGIIGGGLIAYNHGPVIASIPGARIVGIADRDLARARTLATHLSVPHIYDDAAKMIDQESPDVVHILVPPALHADLSVMALERGCHVLVEKPMALSLADADRMIKAADRNNVRICVDHNAVFYQVVQDAIRMTREGLIGDIVSVDSYQAYDPNRNPVIVEEGAEFIHWSYRLNGGILHDLMPHPGSLLMEFLPDILNVSVMGKNRGVLPEGWQDEIRVLIESSGPLGYISISLNEKPDTTTLTVKGTRGQLHIDIACHSMIAQLDSPLPKAATRGLFGFKQASQHLKGAFANVYRFAFNKMDKTAGIGPVVNGFYKAIENGGEAPISVDKSLRVVELLERIWPEPLKTVEAMPAQESGAVASPSSTPPEVLITGASGFIGTHLLRSFLADGVRVRALVRANSMHAGRLRGLDVDLLIGDLSDPDLIDRATEGIRTIFHAGAAVSNDWRENEEITVNGTRRLIDAALAGGTERFVHFGTLAIYDVHTLKNSTRIDEKTDPPEDTRSLGAYSWSKLATEKLVLDAARERGLGASVVRPGIVIGPLGNTFPPHLGYRLKDRVFLLLGGGRNMLPLTYVENTVDAIRLAAEVPEAIGEVFNLVDDGLITSREFVAKYIRYTEADAKMVSVPYFLPYLATAAYELVARTGLIRKGITSLSGLRTKQASVRYDNTKAKQVLGWEQRFSLEEGLEKTFDWYVARFRR